jgi:hypothetical protein
MHPHRGAAPATLPTRRSLPTGGCVPAGRPPCSCHASGGCPRAAACCSSRPSAGAHERRGAEPSALEPVGGGRPSAPIRGCGSSTGRVGRTRGASGAPCALSGIWLQDRRREDHGDRRGCGRRSHETGTPWRARRCGREFADARVQSRRRAWRCGREKRERATLVLERCRQRPVARDARLHVDAATPVQAVVGKRDEIGLDGRRKLKRLGHPLTRTTPARAGYSSRPRRR